MATKCTALTLRGIACRNNACAGELCRVHDKMIKNTEENICGYVDSNKNKCFKKCRKETSCSLHSEDNQCGICYEPMKMARCFMNCTHILCTECFYESIVNKPSCPMCRAPVNDYELNEAVRYLVDMDIYTIISSHTFHTFSLNDTEMELIKNHFILRYEIGKVYNAADMGNILFYLKESTYAYNIFLKMVRTSKKILVKNTEQYKDYVNKFQYKFNIF